MKTPPQKPKKLIKAVGKMYKGVWVAKLVKSGKVITLSLN